MAETGIKRLKESLSIHVAKHSNFTSDRVKDLVVVCDAAPECPLELWHLCDGRGIKDTVARTQRHSDTDASTDDRSWCCGQWQCNCIPVANGCCFWPLCAHSIAGVSSKHAPQTLCVRRPVSGHHPVLHGVDWCECHLSNFPNGKTNVPRVLTAITCSPSSSASPVYEIQTTSKNNTYYPKCNT